MLVERTTTIMCEVPKKERKCQSSQKSAAKLIVLEIFIYIKMKLVNDWEHIIKNIWSINYVVVLHSPLCYKIISQS